MGPLLHPLQLPGCRVSSAQQVPSFSPPPPPPFRAAGLPVHVQANHSLSTAQVQAAANNLLAGSTEEQSMEDAQEPSEQTPMTEAPQQPMPVPEQPQDPRPAAGSQLPFQAMDQDSDDEDDGNMLLAVRRLQRKKAEAEGHMIGVVAHRPPPPPPPPPPMTSITVSDLPAAMVEKYNETQARLEKLKAASKETPTSSEYRADVKFVMEHIAGVNMFEYARHKGPTGLSERVFARILHRVRRRPRRRRKTNNALCLLAWSAVSNIPDSQDVAARKHFYKVWQGSDKLYEVSRAVADATDDKMKMTISLGFDFDDWVAQQAALDAAAAAANGGGDDDDDDDDVIT